MKMCPTFLKDDRKGKIESCEVNSIETSKTSDEWVLHELRNGDKIGNVKYAFVIQQILGGRKVKC